METNNIITESYDDPIIDDSPDTEIDILSTNDVATMDYDEIPDYAVVSADEDNRTVTLERFCEKFKNMVISAIESTSLKYLDFDFYNSDSTSVDIRNIDNLLDFVMWDGKYVTQSSDVNLNKLMSYQTIEEHVTFDVSIWEVTDSAAVPGEKDINKLVAIVRPFINNSDDIHVNKIISIRDFKDLIYPESYFKFNIEDCSEYGCDPEWECYDEDIECEPVEDCPDYEPCDFEDPDCEPEWCDWHEPSF